MKGPISYYGGKATLAKKIVERFPKEYADLVYVEPFCGGASVFFEKQASQLEILNDTNKELINFYRVVQNDFVSLEKQVRITLHSRTMHRDAEAIYANPHLFTDIQRAWAVWVLANQGFSSMLDGSWGYDKSRSTMGKKLSNKRQNFTEEFSIRLQNVSLECADAIRIIESRDSKKAFFYIDPPYYNSDCGHYDGYTIEDFTRLLEVLARIQGRFMLSSYQSPVLTQFTAKNKWQTECFKMTVAVQNTSTKPKKQKIEVLTYNYNF